MFIYDPCNASFLPSLPKSADNWSSHITQDQLGSCRNLQKYINTSTYLNYSYRIIFSNFTLPKWKTNKNEKGKKQRNRFTGWMKIIGEMSAWLSSLENSLWNFWNTITLSWICIFFNSNLNMYILPLNVHILIKIIISPLLTLVVEYRFVSFFF